MSQQIRNHSPQLLVVTRFLRITLVVAALMTALGAWIFAAPGSALGQQYDLSAEVPVLYRAFVSFMLALFAGMYAWMAAQQRLFRPLLWLGVIGKGGAFLTALTLYLSSQISIGPVSMLIGDAVLSAAWAAWLIKTRGSIGPET